MCPEGLFVEKMQKTNNLEINLTEEIKVEFNNRLQKMVTYYKESSNFKKLMPQPQPQPDLIPKDIALNTVGWLTQFKLLVNRALINEFRNPLGVKIRFWSNIIMSIIFVILFGGVLIKNYYPFD